MGAQRKFPRTNKKPPLRYFPPLSFNPKSPTCIFRILLLFGGQYWMIYILMKQKVLSTPSLFPTSRVKITNVPPF